MFFSACVPANFRERKRLLAFHLACYSSSSSRANFSVQKENNSSLLVQSFWSFTLPLWRNRWQFTQLNCLFEAVAFAECYVILKASKERDRGLSSGQNRNLYAILWCSAFFLLIRLLQKKNRAFTLPTFSKNEKVSSNVLFHAKPLKGAGVQTVGSTFVSRVFSPEAC